MFVPTIFTGLMVACSAFLFLKWIRTKKLKLPPGPAGWPLIGNLPVLLQNPGRTNDEYYYTRCARQYGDIYKLRFGPQLMYILCKFDHVREAFSHSSLQGRPPVVAYEMVFGPDAKGIILSSGSDWKVLKQFTVGVFRDLGVGRGIFETKVKSELERFVSKLDKELDNTCWNLMELFYLAISNITCGITFGRQFNYEDGQFMEIVEVLKTFSKSMGPSGLVLTNRILCGLPFGPGKSLRDCLARFKVFLELEIQKQRDDFSADNSPNNFVDAFLEEIEGKENFNKESLITCCSELMFAGTETTGSSLYFAILCLVVNQHIQEEAQKELDIFIKVNGMPCFSDRWRLPYLQGVILEVHRLLCVSPLGVAHVAERDLELFGYDVPKGTILAPNMGSLLMNPEVFPDPNLFNPDRYLKDGKFEAIPDVIPFSIGRRACLGEQLASMEIFLFLTHLLHMYTFKPPKGITLPSILEGFYGGTRIPPPYAVVISKRYHKK